MMKLEIKLIIISLTLLFLQRSTAKACNDSTRVASLCLLREYNLSNDNALLYVRDGRVYVFTDTMMHTSDYLKGILFTVSEAIKFYSDNLTRVESYQNAYNYIINQLRRGRFSKQEKNLILYPHFRGYKQGLQYIELCGEFECLYIGSYDFYLPSQIEGVEIFKRVTIPHYLILKYSPFDGQ